MQPNIEQETTILEWISNQESAMISLLETLVNIDSGSQDKAGVDAVAEALESFLAGDEIKTERTPVEIHGDILRAYVSGGTANRPIVMMGHRDTVFPKGEPTRRPFHIDNGRAYGPGVADMKSGVVINAFLLKAFSLFGGAPAPLVGLFTGDEEIGSPSSRPVIESVARDARAVFNLEPGRPNGNVVTGRKGGVFFKCEIKGKAAHSGANYADGISAIEDLSRKIQAWHALTDIERGVTVNIGLISGGQTVNTVAPHASCEIDSRYIDPDHRDKLVAAITAIARDGGIPGTQTELVIAGEFKPLTQDPGAKQLFDGYAHSAKSIGFDVDGDFVGGCSDAGFTAGIGTPTMCGLGPVGGMAHTPDEYLEVATIVPRAQALALSIMRLDMSE